jgi:hypothetical protein
MLTAVPAEAADVKELFAIDLADYPGKEGRMIEVSYPPGARDMVHRHDAHAFVYVLEGQIVMQLKGPTCRHAQGRADVLRGSYRCSRRVPTEEPADEKTDAQERAHDERGPERTPACGPQELIQRDAGAHPRQINGPHVMERHAGKKVMNP